ncbi:hypothetical protein A2X44_05545 [candidate division CPR3 bacterium GWF2_35_18]|uniref:Triosephosphate isomerase n=1 Tax=candidate division CPR3 bacterium GW2011_GWF2_35_18 TaxID=1618350 RepID=A0A0G0E143_UNCC3|nr:MAG: Triosephosphate isomerase [candidate division CPR3 bacterium GW2011_GWF2_35_18]KKP86560.1 MAG: Triosephosphate isomerase [candidate division CPR3 bacterium GW2011_GWE2_35_7]OGB63215.1 MAG: hypothetical protein A2X44_05545 [candidate division CPR3 bacterium GWF2_35_18]OGB64129.1 MAG: hypothetical protein A2250_03705 [candidate division CPR3 bacterium RIFOXYA2_FULL_35_13]OGB79316.1 MAG: hypothetical protein A2296_02360 [candidate division CPR3 bacterium RIFOXYB2_FULL_35_8]OGB80412.1 MAG:
MGKKIIVGNWKLNKNLEEVADWVDGIKIKLKKVDFDKNLDVVICPAYPYLLGMVDLLSDTNIKVGSQDISQFEEGTYTGEVSGKMLSEIVSYVLIGHSERRKYFKEDLSIIKRKVEKALVNHLIPIVCISDKVWGDGLPAAKYNEKFFLHQIKNVIKGLKPAEVKKIIFAYEPPSAIAKQKHEIGVGHAADVNKVIKVVELIKSIVPESKVIYGGSVKAENIMSYLSNNIIDGVLPGSASLHAQDFGDMIINATEGLSGLH